MDYLIEMHVISFDDRSKFMSNIKFRKDQVHEILQEIITKRKFEELIKVLGKNGHGNAIKMLTPSNKGTVQHGSCED